MTNIRRSYQTSDIMDIERHVSISSVSQPGNVDHSKPRHNVLDMDVDVRDRQDLMDFGKTLKSRVKGIMKYEDERDHLLTRIADKRPTIIGGTRSEELLSRSSLILGCLTCDRFPLWFLCLCLKTLYYNQSIILALLLRVVQEKCIILQQDHL